MPKMQNISHENGVSKEFGTAFSFLIQFFNTENKAS